jgi:hypothetical protein
VATPPSALKRRSKPAPQLSLLGDKDGALGEAQEAIIAMISHIYSRDGLPDFRRESKVGSDDPGGGDNLALTPRR